MAKIDISPEAQTPEGNNYSLPTQELNIAALCAAMSNSWV